MIGKKAANPASHNAKPLSSLPNFLQPYLFKFLDLGLRLVEKNKLILSYIPI